MAKIALNRKVAPAAPAAAADLFQKKTPEELSKIDSQVAGHSAAPGAPRDAVATGLMALVPPTVLRGSATEVAAVDGLVPGSTALVPLHLLAESPYNARVYYLSEEVEQMVVSLQQNGQEVSAEGWVEGGKVWLIDGVKRLRGARAGGLPALRVEIKEKPEDNKALYLKSRRINDERSAQTAIDDAVQFRRLIDEGVFKSQEELSRDLGLDQSTISMIMQINRIPERLLAKMKDSKEASHFGTAYEISRLFGERVVVGEGETVEGVASDLIQEVAAKKLTREKVKGIVNGRITPRAKRARPETREVRIGEIRGHIKVVPERGSVELLIRALSEEQVTKLTRDLEAVFAAR